MSDVLSTLHSHGIPVLTLAWVAPLALAAVVRHLPDARARLVTAIGGAMAIFAVSVEATRLAATSDHLGYLLEDRLGYPGFGYHVGLDGMGAVFLAVANLLGLLATVYGWLARKPRVREWQGWVFVLQGSLNGMIVSLDFALFAAFAVLEILPTAQLVRGWGTGDLRDEAADRAASFLGTSVGLWVAGTAALAVASGAGTDLTALDHLSLSGPWADVAFFLLVYALAVRLPLFPFHAWLPPVIEHGPLVALNVLLLGLKVGAFGLVRFVLPVLTDPAVRYTGLLTAVGLVGLVYGVLVALAQTDLRRMLAYLSLSHMGLVVPGLFTLDVHGVEGALLEALNLGLASAALYFVVGFLYRRTGTTELARLRGAASGLPVLATAFLVITLATIGMPGTSGAEGLHLVLESAIGDGRYVTALGVGAGAVLGGAVLLKVYQAVLVGGDADGPRYADLSGRELAIAGALCASIVAAGVYTTPWLAALSGTAHHIDHEAQARSAVTEHGT
jgi:NADH-quinone oxidoreductase subunit M